VTSFGLCVANKTILEYWQKSLSSLHVKIFTCSTESELASLMEKEDIDMLIVHDSFLADIKNILLQPLHVKVLLLEDVPRYEKGKELLSLGLKGYGNARLLEVHLLDAIETLNNANIWLYPEFIQEMIKDLSSPQNERKTDNFELLTSKQKEVALLVAKGLSNKEIASQLNSTEATIKVHLRTIFEKMKVTDRLSLALALR
jgi:DNA-binding NarL/FixJ family response regulator